MSKDKISYARGFPCGAPWVALRGGATRRENVRAWIKQRGFAWDASAHAWTSYMYGDELREVLEYLRDEFSCAIVPKKDMDANYILDLNGSEGD